MKKIAKIDWKKGFRGKGDAEKVYSELEVIRKRVGSIKPEDVVKRAKIKKSSMHEMFTWDDSEAARLHRLEQARSVIRSIEIVYEKTPNVQARAYSVTTTAATDKEEPRKVYMSTAELLEDPIARDELLSRAIREALSYRRKYHGLSELAKVFRAMDDFVEHADKILAV